MSALKRTTQIAAAVSLEITNLRRCNLNSEAQIDVLLSLCSFDRLKAMGPMTQLYHFIFYI